VEHHSSSIANHNFDAVLSRSVLVMRTHTAELDPLTFLGYFFHKGLSIEDAVVGVIFVDCNTVLMRLLFESNL
jgi:hypothetical protein